MSVSERKPLLGESCIQDNVEKTPTHIVSDNPATPFCWQHVFIVPVTLLMYTAMSIGSVVQTQWIQEYFMLSHNFKDSLGNSNSSCKADKNSTEYTDFEIIEQLTSEWTLYAVLANYIPCFFAMMVIPSYTDALGRKLFILIGTLSMTLRYIIVALSVYYNWHLIWVVVASGLDGLSGSMFTPYSVSMSYYADITPRNKRALVLSCNDGLTMVCLTIAGLVSGYFISYSGFFWPFAATAGIAELSFLLTASCLPETHLIQNRTKSKSITTTVRRVFEFYTSSASTETRSVYIILIIAYFLMNISTTNRMNTEILYQLGRPFCWSSEKIGIYSAARHATQGFSCIVLIIPLKACLSDSSLAVMAAFINAASFTLEGLAYTDFMFYLGV